MSAKPSATLSVRAGARLLVSFILVLVAAAATLTHGASPAAASVTAPSVSASPSTVARGSAVTATWSNVASPTSLDWVGLYPSSSTPNGSYLAFVYTGGAAGGSKALTIPASVAPGSTYQLRLFTNNSFSRLATSGSFTVSGTTLSASPSSVAPGRTVTASWSNVSSPTSLDWVGLYPSASTPNSGYIAFVYTGGAASGSKTLTVPSNVTPGSDYRLRLFTNNSFTKLATSNTFAVTTAPSVSVSPSSVVAGSSVTASWSNVSSPTSLDWVGLYPSPSTPNGSYVAFVYLGGAASGSKALTIHGARPPAAPTSCGCSPTTASTAWPPPGPSR